MQSRQLLTWISSAAAAAAFTIAPLAILPSSDASTQTDGCYNGATVLNPYGTSCTLPGPVSKIRGSAPDANAIIACRNQPGCLATYINSP